MHKTLLQLTPCSFLYSNNKLSMYLKPLSLVKQNSSKDTAGRKIKESVFLWRNSWNAFKPCTCLSGRLLRVILSRPNFSIPLFFTLVSCDNITGQVPPRKNIHTALTCSILTARWDRAIMFPGVAAIIRTRCHTFSASHRSPPQDGMWRRYFGYVIWRVTWVLNKVTSIYIRVKIN